MAASIWHKVFPDGRRSDGQPIMQCFHYGDHDLGGFAHKYRWAPKFVKNQDFLIERHYSIYVTALFFSEFMSYVTRAFDYEILKDVKTMAGLGGALYYPELSISERMLLTIMNKRRPYMPKERNGEIFENFDNEEIEIFAKKIKRIDDAKA